MSGLRRLLRGVGEHAVVEPDSFVEGAYVLSIGGAEQSHVNLAHPERIFYAYLARIAAVLDLLAPPGEPLRVLHLGAGALTLVRYLQVTRPGSRQRAVELERELLDFVVEHLPLPEGTVLSTTVGDARWSLPELKSEAPYDVIVLDVFSGPDAPEHLATPDFYAEAAELLAPDGALIVNIGDEPGLTLVRSQLRAMSETFTGILVSSEPEMFSGRFPGNLVAICSARPWTEERSSALQAKGPYPAEIRGGTALDELLR